MSIVSTSRAQLSVTDIGPRAAPPVLLLHATLHDGSDFAPVRERLSEGRRVITADWPGHGSSPAPAEPLGAPELGDAAIELVDTMDLTRLVVIGNSVGGYAACRIALARPDRVAGIVLVNTGGFTAPSPAARACCSLLGRPSVIRRVAPLLARAYMRPNSAADRAIIERVNARVRTDAGARTAAALWRSFTQPSHDLRHAASDIDAPTLITWGARDLTSPVRWGRAVAAAIPGSSFTTFPTGHVVFSSLPDAWLDEVLPFVESAHAGAERPAASH